MQSRAGMPGFLYSLYQTALTGNSQETHEVLTVIIRMLLFQKFLFT